MRQTGVMVGVLTGFGIIGAIILAGYLVGRSGVLGEHGRFVLGRAAFYVLAPALLFTVLADADVHVLFSSLLPVSLIAAAVVGLAFAVVARVVWRRPVSETVVGTLASGYVNANNIGIPVAVYVLGDPAYSAPVVLLQLLVFAPVALTILDIQDRGTVSVRRILVQPFTNPIIIASALGLLLAVLGVHLPDAVMEPFRLVGAAMVPVVLMTFGMSLHGSRPLNADHGRVEILTASIIKAAVMPLIAFLVAWLGFGMHGHALFAAVALAALPTAQNVYNFAARYERGMPVARDIVLLTTLFAVPALLLIAALLA